MAGTDGSTPIAIIGLSGRFPGEASDPQKLWSVLVNKESTRSEVPPDRFNINAFYHPSGSRAGTVNTRWGHFMKRDPAAFDAPFFSVLPEEARAMDPQSRMALECAFEAFENAGMTMDAVAGTRTACYVASFTHDYAELLAQDGESQPRYKFTGCGAGMLANRISWFFDLQAPSVTVDTACSSSLVALHLGCQSIRTGDADMVLVGGANVILSPQMMTSQSSLGFLSSDGRCKAFDEQADGYARGEGAGFFLLKPLNAALADGNAIRAVIRGTGVNQDGRTPGITVPSAEAQERLIRSVYDQACLDPVQTPFVEAHGTGTRKGDLAEASSLARVFGHRRLPQNPLYIGSVKTNIGHLEAAAGASQVIKTVLALENGIIPPNIWFTRPCPEIPLDRWRLKAPVELVSWPEGEKRRASINSFGYGGTNAHCVMETLEEYTRSQGAAKAGTLCQEPRCNDEAKSREEEAPMLISWSSRDKGGISRLAVQYAQYLEAKIKSATDRSSLTRRLCLTLHARRSVMPWKSYIVSHSASSIIESFRSGFAQPHRSSEPPAVLFVFTGQGAQWPGMGRQLFRYPDYLQSLQLADRFLQCLGLQVSVIDEINAAPEKSSLGSPEVSQTLCTVLQVALVDLLESFGLNPTAVIGHSGGEIAAAYAKGAISREAAWTIAFHRGRLCSSLPDYAPSLQGGMLVAGLGREDCARYIGRLTEGVAVIACVNSPLSCTISGDLSALDQLEGILREAGCFHRRLRVSRAYHSPHMQVIAGECCKAISSARPLADTEKSLNTAMYSTVTRGVVKSSDLGPDYWVSNMVEPVEFVGAVETLLRDFGNRTAPTVLIEIGPHSALRGPLRQILDAASSAERFPYTSLLVRDRDAHHTLLESMGSVLQHGYPLKLHKINQVSDEEGFLVDLPPYPWNHDERNRYWAEPSLSRKRRFRRHGRQDLCGVRVEDDLPGEATWRNILCPSESPWILDHRVQGTIAYPAAGMLTAVIEAVRESVRNVLDISYVELRDVKISRPIIFSSEEDVVHTRLRLRHEIDHCPGSFEFQHYSEKGDGWELNCSGRVLAGTASDSPDGVATSDAAHRTLYAHCSAGCYVETTPSQAYSQWASVGLHFGRWFQNLTRLSKGPSRAIGTVRIPSTRDCMPCGFEDDMLVHPVVLDALVQLGLNTSKEEYEEPQATMVPVALSRVFISTDIQRAPGSEIVGYSVIHDSASGVNVAASDTQWAQPCIILDGLELATLSVTSGDVAAPTAARVPRKLAAATEWLPSIIHTPVDIIQSACESWACNPAEGSMEIDRVCELQRGALIWIQRILQTCPLGDIAPSPPHLRRLHLAMTRLYNSAIQGDSFLEDTRLKMILSSPRKVQDDALQQVANSSIDGEILDHHCRMLDRILRGKMHSIEALLQEGRLYRWYSEGITWRANHGKISSYLRLHARNNAQAKILEIGGGTGGLTLSALRAMTLSDGSALFDSYCFTDISGGFFEKARNKFAAWAHCMSFATLNIEHGLEAQGFGEVEFDLILADNVLHATKSIRHTLAAVRKLLKPTGRLVLSEITRNMPHITMTVGALEGWWLGFEDGRVWEPTLSVEQWDAALRDTGFSGVDICLHDRHNGDHIMTGMVATAQQVVLPPPPTPAIIILHMDSLTPKVRPFVTDFTTHLRGSGMDVVVQSLSSSARDNLHEKTVVLLLDADPGQKDLASIKEPEWEALKQTLLNCSDAVWITRGTNIYGENPWASMAQGLVRSLRAENPATVITMVDVACGTELHSPTTISSISRLMLAGRQAKHTRESHDWEYCIQGRDILIPRVMTEDAVNDAVFRPVKSETEQTPFGLPGTSLKIASIEPLRFVEDPAYCLGSLAKDEVEITVRAAHLVSSQGRTNNIHGLVTVSGNVTQLGTAAPCEWSVGDRVMTLQRGAIRNLYRCPLALCQKIPEKLGDFGAAVRILWAYTVAFYSLVHKASLRAGEVVLIHCTSNALEEAFINLAQHAGAEVFLLVSSEARKNQLASTFSIPRDHILLTGSAGTILHLEGLTMGRLFDVILLHPASVNLLQQASQYLAPGARLALVQRSPQETKSTRLQLPIPGGTCVYIIEPHTLSHEDLTIIAQILKQATEFVQSSESHLDTGGAESFCRSEECFHITNRVEGAANHLLVESHGDTLVPVIKSRPAAHLLPNATYIIAGGSGGLGDSLARWMCHRGARHLVILSRQADTKPGVAKLRKDLALKGVEVVAVPCDITDIEQVQVAMSQVGKTSPPVRGIIQAAMVLEDSVFDNMSFGAWNRAIQPKVMGSWNLHTHCPKDVDFFILLSSFVGTVGLRGQANYAAGNSFQDALAHHRRLRGQSGVSLSLGFIDGAGFLAQSSARVADNVSKFNFLRIQQSEFLRLVELAVTSPDHLPAQVIIGCGTGGMIAAHERDPCDVSWLRDPRFKVLGQVDLQQLQTINSEPAAQGFSLGASIAAAETVAAASAAVLDALCRKLATASSAEAEDIDTSRPLSSYGVDSLLAVDLRAYLAIEARLDISVFELMRSRPVRELARDLALRSEYLRRDTLDHSHVAT